MKLKIKNLDFINCAKAVNCIVNHYDEYDTLTQNLVKGQKNISKITNDTEFEVVYVAVDGDEDYSFDYSYEMAKETTHNNCVYCLLKNKNIGYITARMDNLIEVEESQDILRRNAIKNIIINGNKTILIDTHDNKYITTRVKGERNDLEKALMICILKREGYKYSDIEKMASLLSANLKK